MGIVKVESRRPFNETLVLRREIAREGTFPVRQGQDRQADPQNPTCFYYLFSALPFFFFSFSLVILHSWAGILRGGLVL